MVATLAYDLLVVGSNAAGAAAALVCKAAGWSVAVIDDEADADQRGPEASADQVLATIAEAADRAGRLPPGGRHGFMPLEPERLASFHRRLSRTDASASADHLQSRGVTVLKGAGRFVGRTEVAVGGSILSARRILIATPSQPRRLRFTGAGYVIGVERLFQRPNLPPSVAVIGGGRTAVELAIIASSLGQKVTILEKNRRLLDRFDPDLVSWLATRLAQLGPNVHAGARVEAVEPASAGFRIHIVQGAQQAVLSADAVVHAAGRSPRTANLALAAGNISAHGDDIELNEFLQSVSNPAVYAAGEAAGIATSSAQAAAQHGRQVAVNLLGANRRSCRALQGTPTVAYASPPIAAVGLSEAAARRQLKRIRVRAARTPAWPTAREGEAMYGYKILIDPASDQIFGAHLLGPHADEVINLFSVAVRHGLRADDLRETAFAYATSGADISTMLA